MLFTGGLIQLAPNKIKRILSWQRVDQMAVYVSLKEMTKRMLGLQKSKL